MTVHRDDLEAKLREIEDVVGEAQQEAADRAKLIVIGSAVLVVALIAYRIWRSRQDKIRVEVYHLS